MSRRSQVALRLFVFALLVLPLIAGCSRTRRTVIEEEVGGIGTAWRGSSTTAGIWQDQAALSRALEAALWKLPEEPGGVCKGKPTRVEVVVFPAPSSFGTAMAGGAEGERKLLESDVDRIKEFVRASAERRVGALGCPPLLSAEAEPGAVARVTVAAWGWDVEALATLTTTVRRKGGEVRNAYADEEGLARIRARTTLHLDVYDGSRMQSGSAEGSSKWRVLTGKDARDWPLEQLPHIYEPPSRMFSDEYDEGPR